MENERENRLRQQIEELVRSRVGVLEQDVSSLQREFNDAFTRLLERTDAAANLSDNDPLIGQITAEITAQIDQASTSSVKLGADLALLRDSVVELDQQRNQAEVLNTLVARAANFAPRVVLFVVKGTNALAWAARGFDDSVGNSSIRGLSVALQSDTALRAAVTASQTCYGAPDQQAENHLIFGRLGNVQPQRVLVVPLKVRGKSAAVFYADSADRGESAVNVEAIELLVSTAGLVVELVSLRSRLGEVAQPAAQQPTAAPVVRTPTAEIKQEPAPVATPAPPPSAVSAPEPQPEAVTPSAPEPVAPPAAEVKVEEAPQPASSWSAPSAPEPQQPSWASEPEPQPPAWASEPAPEPSWANAPPQPEPSWTTPEPQPTAFEFSTGQPETYTQPASESFYTPSEPQTFAPPASFTEPAYAETAPAETQGFEFTSAPVAPEPPPPAPVVAAPPVAASEEEEKQHNDARRFARLLVSEIKLYNEHKVTEGRVNKDLYDRLKDDIDRSRQMYEKRVAPTVSSKFDYFYDELVNTLAEGDPNKLGSDYPRPSVAM
ncbi:MAG: hypothetical protein AB1757_25820 [Acidobacteriota bacterium]